MVYPVPLIYPFPDSANEHNLKQVSGRDKAMSCSLEQSSGWRAHGSVQSRQQLRKLEVNPRHTHVEPSYHVAVWRTQSTSLVPGAATGNWNRTTPFSEGLGSFSSSLEMCYTHGFRED